MENLITTFTLLGVVSGERCLKVLKLRESMCFIFSKMERDQYESTIPEDEKELFYEYEINNVN
jgi:hypothetical protein